MNPNDKGKIIFRCSQSTLLHHVESEPVLDLWGEGSAEISDVNSSQMTEPLILPLGLNSLLITFSGRGGDTF